MTDYFALLDQPRRPWLDSDELKAAFHQRTLLAHPDARSGRGEESETGPAFARLNEAYQVLQDPKRRLHHFLSLRGHAPVSTGGPIPDEVAELFQSVATVSQEAERILQRAAAASQPLSRSLLHPEIMRANQRLKEALDSLVRLEAKANDELRALDESLKDGATEFLPQLQRIYFRLAYLTRWISQLEEKQTQLATA